MFYDKYDPLESGVFNEKVRRTPRKPLLNQARFVAIDDGSERGGQISHWSCVSQDREPEQGQVSSMNSLVERFRSAISASKTGRNSNAALPTKSAR